MVEHIYARFVFFFVYMPIMCTHVYSWWLSIYTYTYIYIYLSSSKLLYFLKFFFLWKAKYMNKYIYLWKNKFIYIHSLSFEKSQPTCNKVDWINFSRLRNVQQRRIMISQQRRRNVYQPMMTMMMMMMSKRRNWSVPGLIQVYQAMKKTSR